MDRGRRNVGVNGIRIAAIDDAAGGSGDDLCTHITTIGAGDAR